jgi:hypothetical protein
LVSDETYAQIRLSAMAERSSVADYIRNVIKKAIDDGPKWTLSKVEAGSAEENKR